VTRVTARERLVWGAGSHFIELGEFRDPQAAHVFAVRFKLLYSTYLGTSGSDYCRFVAVDGKDRPVLTVETNSPNYPTTRGAFDTLIGDYDVALTRLNVSFGSGNPQAPAAAD